MLKHILNKYIDATCTHAIHAITEDSDTDRIARIAQIRVARPIKTDFIASGEPVSNWWLITFEGLNPVQIAIWPPCTKAEAMALNQNSISIIPIPSPVDEIMEVTAHE
ncbi:MAG: hypothetical protein H7Z18_08255 [Methylophilaceae bacterium]|nr:hypothetical protein [Methylophilaceae bacterium]